MSCNDNQRSGDPERSWLSSHADTPQILSFKFLLSWMTISRGESF